MTKGKVFLRLCGKERVTPPGANKGGDGMNA